MWQGKGKVAIAGIGFSEISRRPQKPLGLLAVDACRAAIADAGLAASQIDGLATYPESPFAGAGNRDGEDIVSVNWMMNHLALAPDLKWYAQIETGMIASPIIEAANALIAGACEYVLVWRALHRPQARPSAGGGRGGPPRATGDAQFLAPYGAGSIVQTHAFAW
jgi:acetyl-CoA acetyltransferase